METKNCIGCNKLVIRKSQKPGAFKKIRYCSSSCALFVRNRDNNPMSQSNVRIKITGNNHYNWKGDSARYFGIHSWVRKYADLDMSKCSECGEIGKYWKNKRWSIEYANISGEYKRELTDWRPLCRKCHRKFDNTKRELGHKSCPQCHKEFSNKFINYCKLCPGCRLDNNRLKGMLYMRKKRSLQGRI